MRSGRGLGSAATPRDNSARRAKTVGLTYETAKEAIYQQGELRDRLHLRTLKPKRFTAMRTAILNIEGDE